MGLPSLPSQEVLCATIGTVIIPTTARIIQVAYAIVAGFALEQCIALAVLESDGEASVASTTRRLQDTSAPALPPADGLLSPSSPPTPPMPPPSEELALPPPPPMTTASGVRVYQPLLACGPGVTDISQCTPITLLVNAAAVSATCSILGVVAYLATCALRRYRGLGERTLSMLTGFAFFLVLCTLQGGISMVAISYFCDVYLDSARMWYASLRGVTVEEGACQSPKTPPSTVLKS